MLIALLAFLASSSHPGHKVSVKSNRIVEYKSTDVYSSCFGLFGIAIQRSPRHKLGILVRSLSVTIELLLQMLLNLKGLAMFDNNVATKSETSQGTVRKLLPRLETVHSYAGGSST